MKKKIAIIGGFVIAAAFMTFGAVNWHNKIETTSEMAKEKIETVRKTNPELTGDAPLSRRNSTDTEADDSNAPSASGINRDTGDEVKQEISGDGITGTSIKEVKPASPAQRGKSVEEIKSDYYHAFSELEILENSKVDQLLLQAKADYVSGKYTKEDLIIRYQEMGLALEAQADMAFQAIYTQLESDLERNGHDVNEAIFYRNEYERKKEERLSHVVNKLSEF